MTGPDEVPLKKCIPSHLVSVDTPAGQAARLSRGLRPLAWGLQVALRQDYSSLITVVLPACGEDPVPALGARAPASPRSSLSLSLPSLQQALGPLLCQQ